MEETAIVVMLKNAQTGMFDRELCNVRLEGGEEHVSGVYAQEEDGGTFVYLTMSVPETISVEDWEYDAIFDYYDLDNDAFSQNCVSVDEIEGRYNPEWIFKIPYTDQEIWEKRCNHVLKVHIAELEDVLEVIKDKRSEYM